VQPARSAPILSTSSGCQLPSSSLTEPLDRDRGAWEGRMPPAQTFAGVPHRRAFRSRWPAINTLLRPVPSPT